MGKLCVKSLEVECVLGDLPEERITPCTVLVDVEIYIDSSKVCVSDDLADTVDYAQLADQIRTCLITGKFRMIERATQEILNTCLSDSRIIKVCATLHKPNKTLGLVASFTLSSSQD